MEKDTLADTRRRHALEEFEPSLRRILTAHLRGRVATADIDDLVQEGVTHCARQLPRLNLSYTDNRQKQWLITVARNAVNDALDSRRYRDLARVQIPPVTRRHSVVASVRLTHEQYEFMSGLALAREQELSTIMREAVGQYIARERAAIPGFEEV